MQKTILSSIQSMCGIFRINLLIPGICAVALLLTGCGANNNFTFTTSPGACPNGMTNAPYCISVTITNNGNGQNFINSTTAPISNLVVDVSGASNIQTPTNSTSTIDPNGCTTKTLNPGSSCTFFLKISSEAYSTTTTETISINMTYTIKNTLFGAGSSYSNSFTIYQVTNLYIMQGNGNLIIANAAQVNSLIAESTDTTNNTAVDTNSFGFLYVGGNNGVYQYGNSLTAPSIGTGGSSNLFTLSTNLYIAGNSPTPAVAIYSLAGESLSSSAYLINSTLTPNANSVSPDGTEFYLANSNQVISCPIGGANPACVPEGVNLPGVQTLAATNVDVPPFTGLYAGTNGTSSILGSGLFAESGTSGTPTAQWIQVTQNTGGIIGSILSSTVNNGNLYAGDISGNIWFISNASTTPLVATQFLNGTAVNGGGITNMVIDSVASILYFIVRLPSTTTPGAFTYTLYACSTTSTSCTPSVASGIPPMTNSVVGLNIGSQLVSSLTSQPN